MFELREREFKVVVILTLEFTNDKMMIKQYITPFIRTQKQKILLMKVILMICLNQFILRLYKSLEKKVQFGWLVQS